jgi:hypothetical protein
MKLLKTTWVAALFGIVAQLAAPAETKPMSYPATVAQSAERFLGGIQADVSSGMQSVISTKLIGVKDLDGLLGLLNSSAIKLRDAGYADKLTRASQQVEAVNSQMVAAVKDPGNKEVFATGLEPEIYLQQIRLQQASGVVLEKKLIRLRNIVEELRKAMAILEPVTPAEHLDERIKLRLTQLLGEWNQESGSRKTEQGAQWAKERSVSEKGNAAETKDQARDGKIVNSFIRRLPIKEESRSVAPRAIAITPAAAKIVRMSQEGVREKVILKYINKSSEPYQLKTADQILYLRTNHVSSPLIVAMLDRDATLEQSKR